MLLCNFEMYLNSHHFPFISASVISPSNKEYLHVSTVKAHGSNTNFDKACFIRLFKNVSEKQTIFHFQCLRILTTFFMRLVYSHCSFTSALSFYC